MFHGKHVDDALQRAARWAGLTLDESQLESLVEYAEWLVAEAIPAGAVGPAETDRIIDRHVADALVFAAVFPARPPTLVDVGSGAGLPGIPLGIAYPEMAVTLLDRSQRRTDLAARASRILGLQNVQALQGDVVSHPHRYGAATFRATLPGTDSVRAARLLIETDGVAVVGWHRGNEPAPIPAEPGDLKLDLLETPEGVLDSPAWHLRITVR